MSEDFITPPTKYPFRPGEAVYVLPSTHRMMAPPPQIPAVVLDEPYIMTRVQFSDGRQAHVNTHNLAYRGFCPHCDTPAVVTRRGRMVCRSCGGPVIDQPMPDELVALRFPIAGWHTAMLMHRAIVNPSWTYQQASVDASATIERVYQGMLKQLSLTKPVSRTNADSRAIDLLRYYSLLEHEAAFLATYYTLIKQSVAYVPLAA